MYSPRNPTEPLNGDTMPTLTSPVNPVGAGVAVAAGGEAKGTAAGPQAAPTNAAMTMPRVTFVETDHQKPIGVPIITPTLSRRARARRVQPPLPVRRGFATTASDSRG